MWVDQGYRFGLRGARSSRAELGASMIYSGSLADRVSQESYKEFVLYVVMYNP